MKEPHNSGALHVTQKGRRRRLEIQRLRTAASSTPTQLQAISSKLETTSSNRSPSDSHSPEEKTLGGCAGGLIYGHVSMMGRRRVMEDAITAGPAGWMDGEYSLFAVYDGHGGVKVAQKCEEKLHNCLARIIEKAKKLPDEKGIDWEKVMVDCFRTINEELEEADAAVAASASERERMMGSTAVVVVVAKEEMVVANCGDSRAVLCRGGAAVPLSSDHKPDREDERERIEAAGGRILNWNGWRVQGILSTSRSLGDHYLKPYVTWEPEVTITRRSESDEFLIIATDGLFDVVSNDIACEVVRKCVSGRLKRRVASDKNGASEAAAALAELAIAKGSRDNISVIVVQLK